MPEHKIGKSSEITQLYKFLFQYTKRDSEKLT